MKQYGASYVYQTQPSNQVTYIQTASSLYSAILAIMLHPEVQARAQAEIDSVVGTERLPTLQDRDQLPYVVAVVKEALRWFPPAPEGGL